MNPILYATLVGAAVGALGTGIGALSMPYFLLKSKGNVFPPY